MISLEVIEVMGVASWGAMIVVIGKKAMKCLEAKLDAIKRKVEFISMKASEIVAFVQPIQTTLNEHGAALDAAAVQLEKAKAEIVAALGDSELPAEGTAALETLSTIAAGLAAKSAPIKAAAEALDQLNPDTPTEPPPV